MWGGSHSQLRGFRLVLTPPKNSLSKNTKCHYVLYLFISFWSYVFNLHAHGSSLAGSQVLKIL